MVEELKLQYKKPGFIRTKIITLYTAKLSLKQSMLKIAIKQISGINQKHQKNAETEWGDKNGTTEKITIQNTLKNIEKQIVCV